MNNREEMKVAIIIVSWNAKEYLEKCLSSIFKQTYSNFDVIFVDNGSTDGSVEYVRTTFPVVKLLPMDQNYGFAKANNIGIETALNEKAVHLVLLNSDTIVDDNFLKELVVAAESDNTIGCCQPKMLSIDNPRIIDAIGISLTKKGIAFQIGYDEKDLGQYDESIEVFGANAGAVLYKSEMLIQIGLFEEECFIYYEDVDLALRARLAGWKCLYVPKAVVYHKHSITFGKHSPFKNYLLTRNQYYYVIKDLPLKMVFRFLIQKKIKILGLMLGMALQLTFFNLKGFQSKASIFKGHIHGIKNLPKMLHKRMEIQSKRVISDEELLRWFI